MSDQPTDTERIEKLMSHPIYYIKAVDPFGRTVFLCYAAELRTEIDSFDPNMPEWKKPS